ncbi:MAG: hypothetical protein IJO88_05625 [Oscillospiraceae bacterium]|nr:hypothetical protein [Oscillospiraceae bacterium]
MKALLQKIAKVAGVVYGYGIMLALVIGGLSFFGYVAALIVGGNTAAAICDFIYKQLYPILVYGSSAIVVLGLIIMYLKGEKALSAEKKKKDGR